MKKYVEETRYESNAIEHCMVDCEGQDESYEC